MNFPARLTNDHRIQTGDLPDRAELRRRITNLSLLTMLCLPVVSHAQTTQANTEELALEEITVTATRLQRDGFTSPTPVTTIDSTAIAASGATNIADVLNEVPSFRPSYTSTSSDSRTFAPGATYADLRGLGSIRTLVLVDGQRFVPQVPLYSTAITNQVDLNVIPTIAIQRLEVVTGGASAAWGSDAVAGVTNMILHKNYQGLKFDVSGGMSDAGDNESVTVSVLGGTSLFNDRAQLVLAASYDKQEGADDILSRDWGKNAPFAVLDTTKCSNCYTLGTGYQYATVAPGGLIPSVNANAAALRGYAFGPGGTPFRFPYGNLVSGTVMLGGSVPNNYASGNVHMKHPLTKESLYGYFDYELTDNLTANVTINGSKSHVKTGTREMQMTYTIRNGNPFIPAQIQPLMGTAASFTLGVFHTELGFGGRLDQEVDNETKRVSAGLNWDLGGTWKADMYYTYGDNLNQAKFLNAININKAAQAVDVISSTSGPVCRNPANGCVPFNPFGIGSASPAAYDFILTDSWTDVHYIQQAGAINLSGDPFSTWAGAVSIATGFEYRKESQRNVAEEQLATNQIQGSNFVSFSGSMNVQEFYLEALVPLLKDLPLVSELDLNAAGRATDYSTIGKVETWKLGLTWNVTDDLLFRATRSRDIRAPNLTELFFPQTVQNPNTPIPGQSTGAPFITGGNANLDPEIADSILAGVTYSPSSLPGLRASVDFYNLDLNDVINSAGSGNIINACASGYAPSCAQITRVNGVVTSIQGGFSNIANVELQGVDFEVSYTTPLSGIGLPGSLDVRALATYTTDVAYQDVPGAPTLNYVGQTGQGVAIRAPFFLPKLKATLNIGYRTDRLSAALVTNYTSASKVEVNLEEHRYANNNLPTYVLYDLQGSYKFGENKQIELYGTVENLFDKGPPLAPNLLLFIPTNPAVYDVIGRNYKLGVRYTF